MKPQIDRLAFAKARPVLCEDAVRTALRDAIAWRIGGGGAPSGDAFAAAAVAAARQSLDAAAADSAERSRTLSTVAAGAKRLSASALGRRLMSVPISQFVRLPPAADAADAIVRDREKRLHAIGLRLAPVPFEAALTASAIARWAPLSVADRLGPLTIHIFDLGTGQRLTFVRELMTSRAGKRVA